MMIAISKRLDTISEVHVHLYAFFALFGTINPEASTMTKQHTIIQSNVLERKPLYSKSLSIKEILIFTIIEY